MDRKYHKYYEIVPAAYMFSKTIFFAKNPLQNQQETGWSYMDIVANTIMQA